MALGGNKESKPTRMNSARERLEVAMGRLDKALAAKEPGADTPELGQAMAEMAGLRDEKEKLMGLNKITGERLDSAIKRLKTVLEEV